MHRCDLCGKEFPRPSGLRTHMNSHNDERRELPYACEFPGCDKRFSVLSNCRRHYRTHGVEPPSPSLRSSSSGREYAVNFDAPMTPSLPAPAVTTQAPFRVRWIAPNAPTCGTGWGEASSTTTQ
ncbi:hypothetical protein C8F01DRAFT_1122729 [Mycena amicta]|nr:hypothetical protein C8F01DRAFT_1122729 [Mycena amicta]